MSDQGDVLPPEGDEEDGPPETVSPQARRPLAGRRRRERSLKVNDKDEEISERAMLIQVLGKDAKSTRVLEIFDKARHREGGRAVDLQGSQRAYIYAMMAREEKQAAYIGAMQDKTIELLNQVGELIISKAQASTTGKAAEVVEAVVAISGIPVIAALQEMVLEWMLEKKNKAKEEKNKKA